MTKVVCRFPEIEGLVAVKDRSVDSGEDVGDAEDIECDVDWEEEGWLLRRWKSSLFVSLLVCFGEARPVSARQDTYLSLSRNVGSTLGKWLILKWKLQIN